MILTNLRQLIHFHGLAWVGLSQWFTQKAIINDQITNHIIQLFNKIYQSSISPELYYMPSN